MAYEFKRPEDEQEEKPTGPTGPFAPGFGTGGGAVQAAPQAAPAQSKFVNFDRILNANKDVATRNANQLAGALQTNAQAGRTALAGVVGGFNSAVTAGTPQNPMQPNGTGTAPQMPTGRATPTSPLQPSANTRGTPAPSSGTTELGSFKGPPQDTANAQANLDKAVYSGPTDITKDPGFAEMWGKVGKSDDELALLEAKGGLGALSQNYLAGGQYTQGMQNMDAALLGATGGERFRQVKKEFGDTRKLVDRAVGEAGTKVKTAQGLAGDAKNYWQGVIDKNAAAGAAQKSAKDAAFEKATKTMQDAGRFADYEKWRHEDAVRSVGNALDPTYYLGKLFGLKGGVNDALTDKLEPSINPDNNSNRVTSGTLPPHIRPMWPSVFSSLSEDELRKLEMMSDGDRVAFIQQRYAQLQG